MKNAHLRILILSGILAGLFDLLHFNYLYFFTDIQPNGVDRVFGTLCVFIMQFMFFYQVKRIYLPALTYPKLIIWGTGIGVLAMAISSIGTYVMLNTYMAESIVTFHQSLINELTMQKDLIIKQDSEAAYQNLLNSVPGIDAYTIASEHFFKKTIFSFIALPLMALFFRRAEITQSKTNG